MSEDLGNATKQWANKERELKKQPGRFKMTFCSMDRSDQFVACEKLKTHCCGWQRCGYLLKEHVVQSDYSSLCVEMAWDQISLQFSCFYACVCSRKTKPYTFFIRLILLLIYVCACLCVCLGMCLFLWVSQGTRRGSQAPWNCSYRHL